MSNEVKNNGFAIIGVTKKTTEDGEFVEYAAYVIYNGDPIFEEASTDLSLLLQDASATVHRIEEWVNIDD